jgi:short subunit dehydrogenase-like uncharacterized protein
MRDAPWILYGANGVTGRLVLAEALRRGHRPIVAGRDPSIHALGEAHRLESACVPLDDADGLATLVRRGSRVLHIAGPYTVTAQPMLDACLATRTPYLDLDGEIGSVSAMFGRDAETRAARIPVIVGAGFGVSAAESIALYMANKVPDARRLLLGVNSANGYKSVGAALSTLHVLGHGGAWIERGSLQSGAIAHTRFRATVDAVSHTFVAAPLAETLAVHRSTGIPEVVAGIPVPSIMATILRCVGPFIPMLLRRPRLRRFLERRMRKAQVAAPPLPPEAAHRSFVWAQASGEHGTSAAVLSLGEGYAFAAAAMVRASERLSSFDQIGIWTPGAAFGADFATQIEGVRRYDA